MNDSYLVSIIVPVYNVEKYIAQCIESLLNQTYKNCEFIFVNDGTKDNSVSIIKKYIRVDNRIKLVNQKNKGVSAARNNGLKKAQGDFIIFVDSDDYLANDYVEYMLNLVEKNKSDFAFSTKSYKEYNELQTSTIIEKNISSDEAVATLLSPDVTVGCWNKIYRKSFIDKNNIKFLTNLYYGEGLQFIIDCSISAKNVAISNKKVYYYRKNNVNSATTKYSNEKFHNGEKSLDLIKSKINIKNDKIKSMYLLHLSTFYLGAIVKIIENDKLIENQDDYKNWMKKIKINLKYILVSRYISFYRKCMIFVGAFFPHIIAKLDSSRSKRIIHNSVE